MTVLTLRNSAGMTLTLTTVGASAMRLQAPGDGDAGRDLILGLANEAAYGDNPPYLGALVGRVAGRIWPTRVSIGGAGHDLQVNEGAAVHLHGGLDGWHRRDWAVQSQSADAVTLGYLSPDGEGGYPGAVRAEVRYAVTPDNAWTVEVSATTDALTPVSLTQHAYFNLKGDSGESVETHTLRILARETFGLAPNAAADGTLARVVGTALDFTRPAQLGPRVKTLGGLDHCFRLDDAAGQMRLAAELRCPGAPFGLDVLTDQPALQAYSGNFLDGSVMGRAGPLGQHTAICLEAQEPPNAVNHPGLGPVLLAPGERYARRTAYRLVAA